MVKIKSPTDDHDRNLDEIAIRNLEVRSILGLYPFERRQPQPLFLDVIMHLNVDRCVSSHDLNASIDYGAVVEELQFILQYGKFELLETAAHSLCYFLLGFRPIDRLRMPLAGVGVTIRKPKALAGAAFPEISLYRGQSSDLPTWSHHEGQKIRRLHRNGDCVFFQVDLGSEEYFCHELAENFEVTIFSWSPLIKFQKRSAHEISGKPSITRLDSQKSLGRCRQSKRAATSLLVLIKAEPHLLTEDLGKQLIVGSQKEEKVAFQVNLH